MKDKYKNVTFLDINIPVHMPISLERVFDMALEDFDEEAPTLILGYTKENGSIDVRSSRGNLAELVFILEVAKEVLMSNYFGNSE